jgi:hypothetical protein
MEDGILLAGLLPSSVLEEEDEEEDDEVEASSLSPKMICCNCSWDAMLMERMW